MRSESAVLNGLDLFSGIGGLGKALDEWVNTIAYCEKDRYAQGVLLSRMAEGLIPVAPVWDDVTTLKGNMLPKIDIIFGGFPCQDISVAGNGKGLAGERSGLFFEIIRLTKETRAPFVFVENVPAIRTRGLREVIRAFTEIWYDCRWMCLSAKSVGAEHKRERWFLLAHTKSVGVEGLRSPWIKESRSLDFTFLPIRNSDGQWKVEPDFCRVVNGLPYRVDRIKCLGNSVVPQQAKEAFKRLCGF